MKKYVALFLIAVTLLTLAACGSKDALAGTWSADLGDDGVITWTFNGKGKCTMPDDYMDSIEPFNYADLKPFSTAYLPGFLADKYDVSVEDSRERADKRCAGSLVSALERTVSGYTSCNETSRDIHLKRGKVHYALLPVWILNTRWEGKDFLFAMNGQTGKLVGKLPVSTKRVVGLFAAIAALLIAISVTALLLLVR